MQAYATIYPWAVMILAVIAALMSIVGGTITGYRIASAPLVNDFDSRTASLFGGFVCFIVSCLVAMLCLYVGGKFVGAF